MLFLDLVTQRSAARSLCFVTFSAAVLGCGNSSSISGTSTATAATTSVYPAAYKAASWSSNTTITFPGSCSMTYATTGVPAVHDPYYLAPAANGQTVVATTPVSHMSMALIAYPAASLKGDTVTLNVCPTAASSTTASNMGAIGFMISGVAIYNSYEATGVPALSDNASYTFKDSTGVSQTAYFLDGCSSHAAANGATSTWHYHGVPSCVTALVDTATGPSHLIGFALDGYPIYGGRDLSGNVITLTQLDACNGITSATPEFPAATYHYVLPLNVTGSQSSISCFHGSVNATVAAAARRLACRMPNMVMAMGMPIAPVTAADARRRRS